MDIKIKGLSYEILVEALNQAKDGRLHILSKLTDTIEKPNADVKAHAPKMITRTIPGDYIGALIGPGGKNIQELQRKYKGVPVREARQANCGCFTQNEKEMQRKYKGNTTEKQW